MCNVEVHLGELMTNLHRHAGRRRDDSINWDQLPYNDQMTIIFLPNATGMPLHYPMTLQIKA